MWLDEVNCSFQSTQAASPARSERKGICFLIAGALVSTVGLFAAIAVRLKAEQVYGLTP